MSRIRTMDLTRSKLAYSTFHVAVCCSSRSRNTKMSPAPPTETCFESWMFCLEVQEDHIVTVGSGSDPGSWSASKNLSIFNPKIVSKLEEIWSWMFIQAPDLDFLPIPDPKSKDQRHCIPDPHYWQGQVRQRGSRDALGNS